MIVIMIAFHMKGKTSHEQRIVDAMKLRSETSAVWSEVEKRYALDVGASIAFLD